MEAEALTTYTSALADEPEAIDPEVAGSVVSETALADSAPTGSESSPAPVGSDNSSDNTSDKTFASFGIVEPICAALAA